VTSGASRERHRLDELAAEQSVPALLATTAELLYDNRPSGFTTDHVAIAAQIVQSANYELSRLSSQ
jgi:hypothetical protein